MKKNLLFNFIAADILLAIVPTFVRLYFFSRKTIIGQCGNQRKLQNLNFYNGSYWHQEKNLYSKSINKIMPSFSFPYFSTTNYRFYT